MANLLRGKNGEKNSPQEMIDLEKNYLKIIGENIRRLRGRETQSELAKRAKVGRSTISIIEQGKTISLNRLLRIAKALNINPADLFISDEDRQEISYKHKLLMDKLIEPIKTKKEG